MNLYTKKKVARKSIKNSYKEKVFKQLGALCFRKKKGKIFILIITSRRSKRWTIPKGWKLETINTRKSVALEAWEEAGAQGKVSSRSIGRFLYRKRDQDDKFVTCDVNVYALEVMKMKKKFPEQDQRKLKWVNSEKVQNFLLEPELKNLLVKFVKGNSKV